MLYVFESLEAMLEQAEKTEGAWPDRSSREVGPSRTAFTKTRDFASAVRLAREGWPEGREACEAARAHFEHVTGSRVHRAVTVNQVAGFAPDVPSFLCGAPDCMFAREEIETDGAGKILRLVVQGATSAAISPDEIIRRGALIVALIDALETAGRSVEVYVSFAVAHAGSRSESVACVKRAGEPVEIDRLAFVLAHPSMQRRIGFACWEMDREHMREMSRNGAHFGYVSDAADRGDLYIPGSDLRVINDGAAVAWFLQQLAAVGITFDA